MFSFVAKAILHQAFLLLVFLALVDGRRSFTIDYDRDTFLKDDVPFQYLSGSIHYSRVPYYYWEDRLMKMAAAGLDAAQVYVPWNVHEPQPGVYDFSGQQNLSVFLEAAQKANLLVILRGGPYICGEWEYGGLPAWLLGDNETMVVRTMDEKYIAAVDRWLSVLYTYIKPYVYSNGGPIIMVQLENEYGSYRSVDCGQDYMAHLYDVFYDRLQDSVLAFTTDGSSTSYLECGTTPKAYATVDFGPTEDVRSMFADMRKWNPKGPLVNSELYTGWLDYWGGGHAHGDTVSIISTLKAIRDYNASANLYMFEGGTSFGYMNGADPTFNICPTSYDYDGPLTEAGDITDKYVAIRNFTLQGEFSAKTGRQFGVHCSKPAPLVPTMCELPTRGPPVIAKHSHATATGQYKKQLPPVPPNVPKYAYGKVAMTPVGSVTDLLDSIAASQPLASHFPLNMEQSGFYYGFVLYRHVFDKSYATSTLSIPGIRDRGYVLVDKQPRGMVDRNQATSFNMNAVQGQTLDIIVENQGRLNYGAAINDNKKGLISNITFGGQTLSSWKMYPLNITKIFDEIEKQHLRSTHQEQYYKAEPLQPAIYSGSFVLPNALGQQPQDTYLKMCGWFKGQAFINGFNLGRYWPVVGPQVTLYVPAGVLRAFPNRNVIVLIELESSPTSRDPTAAEFVEFVDSPIIDSRCFSASDIG